MSGLAIQPWGHYALALGASVECLRVTPWTQTSSTPEMLRLGVDASPECSCLSFKASTGHFIKAAMEGVAYGVMVNSRGTCRLRYYREAQQKILWDRGLNLHIFGLGYDGVKPPLIRYFDPEPRPFLQACARARLKTLAVDDIERQAWRVRARETRAGAATRAMNRCLDALRAARTSAEIREVRRAIPDLFARVEIDPDRKPLRVGLLGEATVLRDRFLNHNLEDLLGGMGVDVCNFFLMGDEIRNIFHLGLWSRNGRRALRRDAAPWLATPVGGHAMESVAHTVRCAREGFDGVVHVCPTGCMPEISIRPILRRIGKERDFPILECSFDEHSSHVGVVTRLEAFVDMLRDRRPKRGER